MNLLIPISIFVAFAVVNVVIVFFVLRVRMRNLGRAKARLAGLAERLGISVSGGKPLVPDMPWLSWLTTPVVLEGEYGGHTLRIYHYSNSSGKNKSPTHARARIAGPNPKGLTLRLYRQGLSASLGKMLGMQDVETGDPQFDDMFMVKTSDPEFVAQAIIPRIREQLHEIWKTHNVKGSIQFQDDEVFYDEVGSIQNEEACERFAAICEVLPDLRGIVMFYNRDAESGAS